MAGILFTLAIMVAYLFKGGAHKLYWDNAPSGKPISLGICVVTFATYFSEYVGHMQYEINWTVTVLSGVCWAIATFPALGRYVRLQAGMTDSDDRKDVAWIDKIVNMIPFQKRKTRGWLGLTLRGLMTGLPFALLLQSPTIAIACATMPVWYWLSLIIERKWEKSHLKEVPWIAEILYGCVIGVSIVIGVWQ